MSSSGLIGRADLVRLCATQGDRSVDDLAAILGYKRSAPPSPEIPAPALLAPSASPSVQAEVASAPLSDIPFWRPIHYEPVGEARNTPAPIPAPSGYPVWSERPATPPPFQPLAPWRELNMRLRHALSGASAGRALDMDRIVARMGEGEVLPRFPRKPDSHWNGFIQVILDHSRRLIPYINDQRYVTSCLRQELRRDSVCWAIYRERQEQLFSVLAGGTEADYSCPSAGTPVLVLGDLGALAAGRATRHFWRDLGLRLQAAGCRPVALFPAALHRCPDELARIWTLIPWEHPGPRQGGNRAGPEPIDQLLRLVAPASRLEPGLLRAIRRLRFADAGLEADLWQHPWLESDSPAGATIAAKHLAVLRQEFAEQFPVDVQAGVARAIRTWRATLPEEIWFDELLNLAPRTQDCLPASDRQEARDYMQVFANEAGARPGTSLCSGDLAWFGRNRARAAPCYWQDAVIGQSMMRLDYALNAHRSDYIPPGGLDPAGLGHGTGETERRLALKQMGQTLRLEDFEAPGAGHLSDGLRLSASVGYGRGHVLAELRSINRVITVTEVDPFWKSGAPPSWASAWGRDEFGAWVEFTVDTVIQRLRWCPPGTFRMGSAEGDEQAYDDEKPQHAVTLTQGFWLFDSPCTQDLWQAVMGDNPSRFQGPDLPVEQVSWEDVQTFLSRLNDRVPGLGLTLPSEAQWEYACRAEPGQAPALDRAAWYEANSEDKTHPVGGKAANTWGLYDMLGNVWEWCADELRDYGVDAIVDPVGSTGPRRVVRGGSWSFTARYVRAACRDGLLPDVRSVVLGFRGARVQVSQAGEGGAEPAAPADTRLAERRGAQGATGAATGLLRLDHGAESARCALPYSGFRVLTDCERLIFDRITKPDWASAIGRDRFGLWTEIRVDKATQRLRWIPPGRFRMGSPAGEPGRWDDEGPQHEVTLTQGFWLFDTPCTQDLWQAVMGNNPSRFKSPDRPVEQVGWDDIQTFMSRLGLTLPTEAQWEYACRAGTETALYTGPIKIVGERNAPALDPIAWYGGNSGHQFDLKDGTDSTNWPQKQYDHSKAGTRPVARKEANPWGLYDMLGNVWEWCADGWNEYSSEPVVDPQVPWTEGALRVGRGGSWVSTARDVRAADRYRGHPDDRNGGLGFRGARVQS